MESELFGHVKGAFAGAHTSRVGFFEKAKGGVLFLDEIGELSLELQVKLLRFLEERSFFPVGSSNPMEVDIQIVTATNRNLEEEVEQGNFRQDLYYRLSVIPIVLSPLRERKEDIPLLANHFLKLFRQQGRTNIERISEPAIEALVNYHWPGNIRQLKNEMERAILQSRIQGHERIELEDLSKDILEASSHQNSPTFLDHTNLENEEISHDGYPLDWHLSHFELKLVQRALEKVSGKKSEAWKLLGLNDRYALSRRVKNILKKYPDIVKDFPLIQKLYHRQIPGKK